MTYKVMQLLMKALERKVLISKQTKSGFISEGFTITHSGGIFTISKGSDTASISRESDTDTAESELFHELLYEFLSISLPA